AGVIGTRKFVYDVWGDTVNIAARMEAASQPNRVLASAATVKALGSEYRFEGPHKIEEGRVLATVVCEAYTAIAWGGGLSHERSDIAGAEGFHSLEGNMCGTAMRGADALPGSKATSRAKGLYRNLGDLMSGRRRHLLYEHGGPHREGEEPKPMMHGHEKSDLVIVAMKPANKAKKAPCGGVCGGGRSGVGGAKGGGQGEYAPAKHALDSEPGSRVTGAGAYTATCAVTHPRQEPYAGKPHVRIWAGGVR